MPWFRGKKNVEAEEGADIITSTSDDSSRTLDDLRENSQAENAEGPNKSEEEKRIHHSKKKPKKVEGIEGGTRWGVLFSSYNSDKIFTFICVQS